MKLPYFQFYVDDYLSSPGVTTCDLAEEGIYVRLLAYSWKHDGCQLPYDMKYLRKLCKGSKAKQIQSVVDRHFEKIEISKDVFWLRNPRLYSEFCKATGISEKRKYAAKCKWNKKKHDASAMQVDMQTPMQNGMQSDAIPDTRYQILEESKDIGQRKKRTAFVKPTIEEVQSYCSERKNVVSPAKFWDWYESNGWRVGKNPMKDWKATVRTWEQNDSGGGNGKPTAKTFEQLRCDSNAEAREGAARILGLRGRGTGQPFGLHKGIAGNGAREGALDSTVGNVLEGEVVDAD